MKISVFTKVFIYTMLLLVLMSAAAVALFAREFLVFYRAQQQRQLNFSFAPFVSAIENRRDINSEQVIEIARTFAENNQNIDLVIQTEDERVLFTTNGNNLSLQDDSRFVQSFTVSGQIGLYAARERQPGSSENITGVALITGAAGSGSGAPAAAIPMNPSQRFLIKYTGVSKIDYTDLIRRSLLMLGIMLVISALGAVLFAKKVTKPLEDEIARRRVIEENQRLFFSAASHELKTPIAAARALVEGMIAGVGDYRDHKKYLRECMKTLDSQAGLVSEILEIVKLSDADTGGTEAVDIKELVEEAANEYRSLAEQKGLIIKNDIKRFSVSANRSLLRRVLSNVIANAAQNTPECGTIRIYTSEEHKTPRLSVLNTGARIGEEDISRLFEPFYKLDAARTNHGSQSGLGLAIVKKALDRMKCPFGLENTDDGVVFWVELPKSK